MLNVLLVIFQLITRIYHPETIDSLNESKYEYISVAGVVNAVMINGDKKIEFRIIDNHKHFLTCILGNKLDQPRIGVEIIVSGKKNIYNLVMKQHIEIDPVEKIEPAE